MEGITLDVTPRETGKKAVRDARRAEMVPCVMYGFEESPKSFNAPELAMRKLIFTDEFNRINVVFEGKTYECVLKKVDFHPVTDKPIHADFQILHPGEKINLKIPVHFEGVSIGQKNGAIAQTFVNEVRVRCLPKDLPNHVKVDISPLRIGQSLMVKDLEIEGLEFLTPAHQTLVTITVPRGIVAADEEEDEAAAEEGEVAEGAEAEEVAETQD
ncbi:MAG: 50S ribosomal protein L25 [Rhodothermales bacterium]